MKNKYISALSTIIWVVAIIALFTMLWKMYGDARIINYSGIVRGATQKLVKEELYGEQDDELIAYLDGVIYDLQTGEGDYKITKNNDEEFQENLANLEIVWETLKSEIYLYRIDSSNQESLYELSQTYFLLADKMVLSAEESSNHKLIYFITMYLSSLIVGIIVLLFIKRQNEKSVQESIEHDKLTGLCSRIGFEEGARTVLYNHPNEKYMMIQFDISKFKIVNNVYGHEVGDDLLKGIATAIMVDGKDRYLTGRLDADTFIILAKKTPRFMEQLREVLNDAMLAVDAPKIFGDVTFAFGIYEIENNTELIKITMDRASIAHKTAKLAEDDKVVWYNAELLERLREEDYYIENIEQGIENEEFQLYLQPQIQLSTTDVVSAEALIRWQLPDGNIVYPNSFIPIFERNGLIVKIDYYMVEQACKYLANEIANERSPITIAVNFSRVTLRQAEFYATFTSIVKRYKIPHHLLEVEVLESALNEVGESVIQMLGVLRSDGFSIAMDDFGAGYSNLMSLSHLPVQILKLDRQFLWGIDRDEKMKTIITSCVEMAHSVGLRVVCEGVEKQSHVEFLKGIGCEYAQGYFYSKPILSSEFKEK